MTIHGTPGAGRVTSAKWDRLGVAVPPQVVGWSAAIAASRKFRDTLTGRQRLACLRPVLLSELPAFGNPPLEHRLVRGGLPAILLADSPDPEAYGEWLDLHFARDVQGLFGVAKRTSYLALLQILLRRLRPQTGTRWL